MGRKKRIGWVSTVIKVIASVSAILAWTGHFISHVDGAAGNTDTVLSLSKENEDDKHLPTQREEVEISVDTESCPIEKPVADSSCDIFYIVVSTIDGKVSALDLHNKGSLAWSVEADSQPLYSSSLANMEMIRNGKKMRLIPSLDGALYQFDGEKVEAIPMSAETLLSSTYRLSDDSMIVGSKDLRNYGIDQRTGEIQFMCGSEGCSNTQGKAKDQALDGSNIIVITRSTQVVRSVDIKHGNEKWNFSVGQHQISLPHTPRPSEIDEDVTEDEDSENVHGSEDYNIPLFTASTDECPSDKQDSDDFYYEDHGDHLKIIVPDGRVMGLSKDDNSEISWEHKFESPIAKAWLLRHGKLEPMSLFDGRHVLDLEEETSDDMENESMPQPLLYIGSHQKLLYIQPSPQMEAVLKTFTNRRIGHVFDPDIKVSWRPYLNTASVRTPIFGGNREKISRQERPSEGRDKKDTSLTVWHEDYPFDTGYFLYPEFSDTRLKRKGAMMLIDQQQKRDEEDGGLMDAIPASLWLYWKEVVAISVTVSVVVHLVLTKFFNPRGSIGSPESSDCAAKDSRRNSSSNEAMFVSSDSTPLLGDRTLSSGEYVSRFASDFECVSCLGKGGFGVVFEAVNKVDDQHYAVKRTMLPRSEGAKEKVLREVRALAKLEHIGIVRYFNAWVESPPFGWQEARDKAYNFSDLSGPTSYSNTASHQLPESQQNTDTADIGKARNKRPANPVNMLKNLPPGTREEAMLETDSIIFASDLASKHDELKQSGSGEFSVHSNLTDSRSRSESGFGQSQNCLFSLAFDVSSDRSDSKDDDADDSRSSIPFSNYTTSSSALLSHQTGLSDQELTGDSVVFEATGPSHTGDRLDWEENVFHEDTDSIVFEKSQPTSNKSVDHENKSSLKDHHTVDISFSSHKKDDKDSDATDKTVPGTKFFLYIQMQLYRKETLKDWLSNNTLNRDRHTVLDIFDQIVCAVDYVHSQGLMHRDLKPSNIFFAADGIVKVGDFGLVTALSVQQDQETEKAPLSLGRHTAEVGTTLYMSPEQIARKPYDQTIDIFSLGLIFLELWIPFSTQMERMRTLQDAKRQVFPSRFYRELPSECELVKKMTSADPSLRPSTAEILSHTLFCDLVPNRLGIKHRKRTISDNSAS